MDNCAKCEQKLEDGITQCTGCGESLVRPGAFTEVVGWVTLLISSIPVIVGVKTLRQEAFEPVIAGGVLAVIGIVLVVVGRGRASGADPRTVERSVTGSGRP